MKINYFNNFDDLSDKIDSLIKEETKIEEGKVIYSDFTEEEISNQRFEHIYKDLETIFDQEERITGEEDTFNLGDNPMTNLIGIGIENIYICPVILQKVIKWSQKYKDWIFSFAIEHSDFEKEENIFTEFYIYNCELYLTNEYKEEDSYNLFEDKVIKEYKKMEIM